MAAHLLLMPRDALVSLFKQTTALKTMLELLRLHEEQLREAKVTENALEYREMQAAYLADREKVGAFSQKLSQVLQMDANSLFGVYKALKVLSETLKKIPDGRFLERNKIEIKSVIGHGAGGVVYQGVLSGSYKVALKRQKSDSDQALQDLQREIDISRDLRLPGIVEYYGLWRDEEKVFMVMKFYAKGSVLRWVQTQPLPLLAQLQILTSASKALTSLKGYVHRDIAARNMLLSMQDDEYEVGIADFGAYASKYEANFVGLAFKLPAGSDEVTLEENDKKFPLHSTAPEASSAQRIWSEKSDVWSFGLTMWEIVAGGSAALSNSPLRTCLSWDDVAKWFASRSVAGITEFLPCPESCPTELIELIYRCVEMDRMQRISAKELTGRLQGLLERVQSGKVTCPTQPTPTRSFCAFLDAAPPTDE